MCARYRLGAVQPLIPEGARCSTCGGVVDRFGHHYFACPGAALIRRHDRLVVQAAAMCRACTGSVVHIEVTGMFRRERHGQASGQRCQKRADIVLEASGTMDPGPGQRGRAPLGGGSGLQVADMAVSSPHAPAYVTAAQRPGGCAELREGCKASAHEAEVRAAGHTFVPVVFETHGALGPRGTAWFRALVQQASVVGQDPDRPPSPEEEQWLRAQLAFEWQQRLSVTLQRGNARAIITRSRRSRDGMGV